MQKNLSRNSFPIWKRKKKKNLRVEKENSGMFMSSCQDEELGKVILLDIGIDVVTPKRLNFLL